jgi:secreted PhoX family phosphatase
MSNSIANRIIGGGRLLAGTVVISLLITLGGQAHAADRRKVVAVDFTSTPAPSTDAEMIRTHTHSKVIVRYADGSTAEQPLSYRILFKNVDKVGSNAFVAGRLYDADGEPLVDLNGDPVIAETPDANSLLNIDGQLFLVTHYEYDWLLGNGAVAYKTKNWYSRMPMSMTLTRVSQHADGLLMPTDQRPIDFSSVDGLWIPCFASQTPWNTHLGSEEDYDLYFVKASGAKGLQKATAGLKALTEVYFRGRRQANPYHYGYITEVKVNKDGSTEVVKHYNMGRSTWEQALIMPDQRTVYFGDDGDHVGLFMFVADKPADLAAGTIYAARWFQVSSQNAGAATLGWIQLGHVTRDEAKQTIDSGVTFDDIFASTTPDANPNWQADGFRVIRAGHSGNEYLKLKPGMEKAAAFLETRRYAAYHDATIEFNKMEGVAVDRKTKHLYLAMSYIEKGMLREEGAPADHIQVSKVKAGGTYRISLAGGQTDLDGNPIDSEWVGTALFVPPALLGEDIAPDALGNTARPDKVANPDNLFFSEKMRTLFIGEDSGMHVNNFVWAYNVDTDKLTRIVSLASGAEATGLQVVDNLNGHAYIMSNAQHQGEWLKSMPQDVKERLTAAAKSAYGASPKGVPNYYLEAPVGYIAGIPGL